VFDTAVKTSCFGDTYHIGNVFYVLEKYARILTYSVLFLQVLKTESDLEVFHEDSDNDVDEHKLRNEHKDDEVDWGDERVDTTIVLARGRVITVVSQRVLNQRQQQNTTKNLRSKTDRQTVR